MFDAESAVDELERSRVTVVWLAPAMVNAIMALPGIDERDLSSVRLVINGGEKMPVPLIKRIQRVFSGAWFADAYGLTETVSGDTFLDRDSIITKLGSVGRPCLHLELDIWDSHGNSVAAGQRGEIVMRGPKVFKGYWRDPKATAKAFEGGWFHTGDIGVRDEDGYLFIVDRLKDMIVSGGENIAGSEVERVLYEHEAVLEAAVVGVPMSAGARCRSPTSCCAPGRDVLPKRSSNTAASAWPASKSPRTSRFSTPCRVTHRARCSSANCAPPPTAEPPAHTKRCARGGSRFSRANNDMLYREPNAPQRLLDPKRTQFPRAPHCVRGSSGARRFRQVGEKVGRPLYEACGDGVAGFGVDGIPVLGDVFNGCARRSRSRAPRRGRRGRNGLPRPRRSRPSPGSSRAPGTRPSERRVRAPCSGRVRNFRVPGWPAMRVIAAGASAFTLMPLRAPATARLRVSPMTAALGGGVRKVRRQRRRRPEDVVITTRPYSCSTKCGQAARRRVERPTHVYRKMLREVVGVGVGEPGPADDAGVVDEDVDPPEAFQRRADERIGAIDGRHVMAIGDRRAPERDDLPGDGLTRARCRRPLQPSIRRDRSPRRSLRARRAASRARGRCRVRLR